MVTYTFYTKITAFSVNSQQQRNVQKHRSGTSAREQLMLQIILGGSAGLITFVLLPLALTVYAADHKAVHLTVQRNHTVLH